MTVEEFREIWFQNAADPPAFTAPRPATTATGNDPAEIDLSASTAGPENDDSQIDAAVESSFLEDLVADRALEDEINRHLGNERFQQALAQADGTP